MCSMFVVLDLEWPDAQRAADKSCKNIPKLPDVSVQACFSQRPPSAGRQGELQLSFARLHRYYQRGNPLLRER